ncbi:MAG TPA: orotidine-5'-phosphate decarboxylase [Pyrinomonadaceae bacterium]|nr:orotidine-5'-phosphate decarboxylase [Pyrinomonadaceae bacterium]
MSKEKLIVALDVADAAEARNIVAELGDAVGAFKIGLRLFTACGPSLVKELVDLGHKVFLDLKFHDIPNTVAGAAVEAARLGVWMFNVHTLGGGEMMRRTVDEVAAVAARDGFARPMIIGVTVLTSLSQTTLSEVGVEKDVSDEVLTLAQLASKYGLDGVVASALECRTIRESGIRKDFVIVTPGIRIITATNDDQKRVMTPGAALANGSDYVVVGRPILDAPNRRAAVQEILKDMAAAD